MIDSCRSPSDTDDTVFEDEYEKVVVMADGTTGNTVKTADDFAKEVAAELDAKKRKGCREEEEGRREEQEEEGHREEEEDRHCQHS